MSEKEARVEMVWPHIWDLAYSGFRVCRNCGEVTRTPTLFGCPGKPKDEKR